MLAKYTLDHNFSFYIMAFIAFLYHFITFFKRNLLWILMVRLQYTPSSFVRSVKIKSTGFLNFIFQFSRFKNNRRLAFRFLYCIIFFRIKCTKKCAKHIRDNSAMTKTNVVMLFMQCSELKHVCCLNVYYKRLFKHSCASYKRAESVIHSEKPNWSQKWTNQNTILDLRMFYFSNTKMTTSIFCIGCTDLSNALEMEAEFIDNHFSSCHFWRRCFLKFLDGGWTQGMEFC
jgi:hypothetical protein